VLPGLKIELAWSLPGLAWSEKIFCLAIRGVCLVLPGLKIELAWSLPGPKKYFAWSFSRCRNR